MVSLKVAESTFDITGVQLESDHFVAKNRDQTATNATSVSEAFSALTEGWQSLV